MSALMRDEVQLAKVELKEEIGKVGKAGGLFGGAALAGWMTAVLLSFAAAWGLAELMAIGWGFLIVAAVWALVGAFLYLRARGQLQHVDLKPQQTIDTLKEDVEWLKNQKP
jgi:Putative Actinobacterial Holin-X, holin superfamily III